MSAHCGEISQLRTSILIPDISLHHRCTSSLQTSTLFQFSRPSCQHPAPAAVSAPAATPISPSTLPSHTATITQQQHTFSPTSTPAPTNIYTTTITSTSTSPASVQPAPTAQAIAAALPPAQTFDFVPGIRALLARLLLDGADKDALQAKDLAGEVAAVKRQIAHAKSVVMQVPDGGRSLGEQEREIRDVKERVQRLSTLIAALGRDCDGHATG